MSQVILLTGSTGFVGQQIRRELLKRGHQLRLIVRPHSTHKLGKIAHDQEQIIESKDLFQESVHWWEKQCVGCDIVIHAAWYAESGQYLQSLTNLSCLTGTLTLTEGAINAKVRRFIGVGTCFEYDVQAGVMSETTPLNPDTIYAATKASAYLVLSSWLRMSHVEFAWGRLFYLYGEDEDPRRLVAYLRQQLQAGKEVALSKGTQIRDFLDVQEAGIQLVELALGSQQGVVNVCSGIPVTVRQLAEQIADEYGRRDLLKFGVKPMNLTDPPLVLGKSNLIRSCDQD